MKSSKLVFSAILIITILLVSTILIYSCHTPGKTTEKPDEPTEIIEQSESELQTQPKVEVIPSTIKKLSAQTVAEATKYITAVIKTTFPIAGKENASDLTQQALLSQKANVLLSSYTTPTAFSAETPAPESIEVDILEVDELNTLSAGNGVIFITRKMLDCAKNERQQAALIAHEIAHISLGHTLKSFDENEIQKSCDNCLYTMLGNGYGAEAEYKADKEAVTILKSFGYSSSDLIEVLTNIAPIIDSDRPDIAATHPLIADRIARLQ